MTLNPSPAWKILKFAITKRLDQYGSYVKLISHKWQYCKKIFHQKLFNMKYTLQEQMKSCLIIRIICYLHIQAFIKFYLWLAKKIVWQSEILSDQKITHKPRRNFLKNWLSFCTLLLSTEHVTTGGKFEVWKNAKIFGKKRKILTLTLQLTFIYVGWVCKNPVINSSFTIAKK